MAGRSKVTRTIARSHEVLTWKGVTIWRSLRWCGQLWRTYIFALTHEAIFAEPVMERDPVEGERLFDLLFDIRNLPREILDEAGIENATNPWPITDNMVRHAFGLAIERGVDFIALERSAQEVRAAEHALNAVAVRDALHAVRPLDDDELPF